MNIFGLVLETVHRTRHSHFCHQVSAISHFECLIYLSKFCKRTQDPRPFADSLYYVIKVTLFCIYKCVPSCKLVFYYDTNANDLKYYACQVHPVMNNKTSAYSSLDKEDKRKYLYAEPLLNIFCTLSSDKGEKIDFVDCRWH